MLRQGTIYIFYTLLFLFFYFGLSAYGLLNNNEGLYAQIAWEMVTSKNWIIPHLNGVPYIEKPPLLYWTIALLFKVFGKSVFIARFVPATFGLLTCVLVTRFSSHKKKNILPGLVLMTFAGFVVFSRMVFFDVALTFFFTGVMLCFWHFYRTKQRQWAYGASLFLAGALLTKGLVSLVLLGFCLLPFLYFERNLPFLKELINPGPIVLCLALVVPWHVLAHLQEQGFLWFYFVNEHIYRFLDQRMPKDYYTGPIYYYLPRLLIYILPWTFVLPFLKGWRLNDKPYRTFLLCWFLGLLVFFSVSRAKANYYMVIGLPPLALYCAAVLDTHKHKFKILGAMSFIAFSMICGGLYWAKQKEAVITSSPSLTHIDRAQPIFLYKRFEELSSLPFYVGRPVPIIQSESRDLWYGCNKHPEKFLRYIPNGYVYVLKRDQREFLRHVKDGAAVVFDAPKYIVYNVFKPEKRSA